MPAIREVHTDGWCVRLDLAGQMLQAEVPEFVSDFRRETAPDCGDDPLLPTLPLDADAPVSAATLLLKSKQFDDGLYAAVEMAAQRGAGRFPGKAALLRALIRDIQDADSAAAATIHAACGLGDESVEVPAPLQEAVGHAVNKFLGDEQLSKPLGFYTWTPELSAIFRQDRFLQQPLDDATAATLLRAVERSAEVSDGYEAWLRLNARLTNPPARPGLRSGGVGQAFLPASRSHEQILIEHLFGDRPVPDGFDLMSELVRRIRSGEIGLEPNETSGWYDRQAWSLEPLVVPSRMPEANRLAIGKRYAKHLEELFRGALALARETHVKQLAIGAGCKGPRDRPIDVYPNLSVEPVPSVYTRRAECYRFVRSMLAEMFGPETLNGMHRLTVEGPCDQSLAEELAAMEELFDGAAAVAHRELGMEPGPNHAETTGRFWKFQNCLASDTDIGRDARMMVPVYFDLQKEKTKVWAFLGWRTVPVDVKYLVSPALLAVEPSTPPKPDASDRLSILRRKFRQPAEQLPTVPPRVQFERQRYQFAIPVMAEVYVGNLLDRVEFRSHCDLYVTRDAILANLR